MRIGRVDSSKWIAWIVRRRENASSSVAELWPLGRRPLGVGIAVHREARGVFRRRLAGGRGGDRDLRRQRDRRQGFRRFVEVEPHEGVERLPVGGRHCDGSTPWRSAPPAPCRR